MLLPTVDLLHVGDALRIVCPESPEICVDRRIGPDGTIDLPSVGPIASALRSPDELARAISDRASEGILPLRVQVFLAGPSPDEVSVSGSVGRPLRLFAPRGIDLDRLLTAAGILPEADRTLIFAHGRVRPGTDLFVPAIAADRRISVVGAVVGPSSLAPANGMTLGRAIEAAGGLSAHADRETIIVVRAQEPIPKRLPADASFVLQPGDVVRVGLIAERHYVVVRGLVASPGSVEYAPGMTVNQALRAAGGILPAASSGTLVWQTGPRAFRLSLAFLSSGRIPDPTLGPEDTLSVEAAKP